MKYKISILIILLTIIIYSSNHFLKVNNYPPYATGTNIKAFLNSTWLMSENEINRANKTSLQKSDSFLSGFPAFMYKIIDENRFKTLVQKDIRLWNYDTEVEYYFFDNKFYDYTVKIDAYDDGKEIVTAMIERFGEPKKIEGPNEYSLKSYEWKTKNQEEIRYVISKDGNGTNHSIYANYIPFIKKIENESKQEIKTYF